MDGLHEVDFSNESIYKEKVWGDTEGLQSVFGSLFLESAKEKMIGEVFLLSDHRDGVSRFSTGETVSSLMNSGNRVDIFGHRGIHQGRFPILFKVLSAREKLSVQNHYSNKVEAWVTLSEGEMLYGLTKRGSEIQSTQEGRTELGKILYESNSVEVLEEYFNRVSFSPGEAYIINAGMVHALLRGTVLEPQMNSNLTNRGGNWGRKDPGRELQLQDFFEALYQFPTTPQAIIPLIRKTEGASIHQTRFVTGAFSMDELIVNRDALSVQTDGQSFFAYFVREGEIVVSTSEDTKTLSQGSCGLLEAKASDWSIGGVGKIYVVGVPDLTQDVLLSFRGQGEDMDEVIALGGSAKRGNALYIEALEEGMI